MAYKPRKKLQERLDIAYAAAAAKEGLPVTMETLTSKEMCSEKAAYKTRYGRLLLDGRYITFMWNHDKERNEIRAIDNLPVPILQGLFDADHGMALGDRYKDENEDFSYQNYLAKGGAVAPVDRHAYLTDYANPESIVINKLCPPDPVLVSPDGVIGMAGKRYDEGTILRMKLIANEYIRSLPEKQQELLILLFCSDYSQKEIARMQGVSTAMISKRKKKFIEDPTKIFIEKGYTPISKKEAAKEAEQQKSAEDHMAAINAALRKLYFPEEDEEMGLA